METIVELRNEPLVYLKFKQHQLEEFFEVMNREKWESADEFTETARRVLAGRELGKTVLTFFTQYTIFLHSSSHPFSNRFLIPFEIHLERYVQLFITKYFAN